MSPFETFRATRFFPAIDGLRAISILGVIAFHCGATWPGILGGQGHLGVALFFMVSGFLITTLLLREQVSTGAISLKKFYIRRTLRIFPLYYGVLAVFCLAVAVFDRSTPEGLEFWRHLPFFTLYGNNWVIDKGAGRVIFAFSWSLATEEQFYLLWPSILKACKNTRAAVAVAFGMAVWAWAMEIAIGNGAIDFGPVANRILLTIPAPISLGCLLAFALHHERSFRAIYPILKDEYLGLAALLFILTSPFNSTVIYVPFFLLLGHVVVPPQAKPVGLGWALSNRAIRHIGVVSYGAYLIHMLVANVGKRLLHLDSPWALLLWTAPITVLAASIIYRYYETPFLRLKAHFNTGDKT
jgi:peptidoglycan/LPS O-acetylase OafA/YrhL